MPHRSNAGAALLIMVAVLVIMGGCASPEELARRQGEAFVQTQQAAIGQTAESLRLTAEAAIKDAIPDVQLPQLPGQPGQPAASRPQFSRLPVASPEWYGGFGANDFARDNWRKYYTQLGGLHNGTDFGADVGTPVYAGLYGIYTGPSTDATKPGSVAISVGGFRVTFGHVVPDTNLKLNQEVSPDTLLGTVGDHPSGDHLHISIREGSRYHNALLFFEPGLINQSEWGGYTPPAGPLSIHSFIPMSTDKANYWGEKNIELLDLKGAP